MSLKSEIKPGQPNACVNNGANMNVHISWPIYLTSISFLIDPLTLRLMTQSWYTKICFIFSNTTIITLIITASKMYKIQNVKVKKEMLELLNVRNKFSDIVLIKVYKNCCWLLCLEIKKYPYCGFNRNYWYLSTVL